MSHTYSAKGNRRYRYYVCTRAQKRGWHECPAPSLPAGEIERLVVDEIKVVGRDPALIAEALVQARQQAEDRIEKLRAERSAQRNALRKGHAELAQLATSHPGNPQLADVHDQIRDAERRLTEVEDELAALEDQVVDEAEVAAALADFDAVWDCLAPREQTRVLELLVEQVSYDAEAGSVSITFRPTGLKSLASGLARRIEEPAA